MALADAAALVPELELDRVIPALAPAEVAVRKIIVTSPEYLTKLSAIMKKSERDVLIAHFVWKTIQDLHSFVISDSLAPYSRLVNRLAGRVRIPPPWTKFRV